MLGKPMDAETKLVFEKMDRQDELISRLALAIPEILTIEQWKTYIFFLKKSQKLLQDTLNAIGTQNLTRKILITSEKEARFHLFNFYSCAYCIRQTMFEGRRFSKGAQEFDDIVTAWKKEAIPRIAISIRNKYQHGSLMEHILHYEQRTKHHDLGEGFFVGYNFEPSTWDKVSAEISEEDARNRLKEILAEHPADPITKINNDFIDSCENISDSIQQLFDRVFVDDLAKKKQLKNEYDEIEKWFEDRGMNRLDSDREEV